MSSSRNFLLRYAPDCTFSSRKLKKLPTVGGGTPPPTARSLRSLGLGRFAPSQRLRPPKCFGSLRHCRPVIIEPYRVKIKIHDIFCCTIFVDECYFTQECKPVWSCCYSGAFRGGGGGSSRPYILTDYVFCNLFCIRMLKNKAHEHLKP